MTRAIALSMLGITMLAPGCSLARAVNGAGMDGGAHVGDTFVTRSDTGVDASVPPVDTGTPPVDMGIAATDMGIVAIDAGHDAAVTTDAGGCRGELDCPAASTTSGACNYASDCATTATMMQTTTSYTCVDSVCVVHMTTGPAPCSRVTDGTACGAARTCAACDATACGGTGSVVCTGQACMGGACAPSATSTPCTTPDDMCGMLSDWGMCNYDGFGSSTCHQTRAWGQCELVVGCVAGFGHSESRSCPCPRGP